MGEDSAPLALLALETGPRLAWGGSQSRRRCAHEQSSPHVPHSKEKMPGRQRVQEGLTRRGMGWALSLPLPPPPPVPFPPLTPPGVFSTSSAFPTLPAPHPIPSPKPFPSGGCVLLSPTSPATMRNSDVLVSSVAPMLEARPARRRRRSRVAAGARRAVPSFSKVTLLGSSPCTSTDGLGNLDGDAGTGAHGQPPAAKARVGAMAAGGLVARAASHCWALRARAEPADGQPAAGSIAPPAGRAHHKAVPVEGARVHDPRAKAKGEHPLPISGRHLPHPRLFRMTDATPISLEEDEALDLLDAAGWLAEPPSPAALVCAASGDASQDGELEF